MNKKSGQKVNIKSCVRPGKTHSEARYMIWQVYGDEGLSRSRAFEWHQQFREGGDSVPDGRRGGSRTATNVERVTQSLHENRSYCGAVPPLCSSFPLSIPHFSLPSV